MKTLTESTKTIIFLVLAGVTAGTATLAHFITRNPGVEGFERVGEPFYPEFDDPSEATFLQVVSFDEKTGRSRQFQVEQEPSGQWVIASHNNYPVEGAERLARTAASVIGIKREALKSRRPDDHKQYGVIDPLAETKGESAATLEGRGDRLVLKDPDGKTLVDLIIGKAVEEENEPGSGGLRRYYVRTPEEKAVYIAALDIDLSTNLADWIESDLLKLKAEDLVGIVVEKYSLEEKIVNYRGQPVQMASRKNRETSELTRSTSVLPWELKGLDATQEMLNQAFVNTLVTGLDQLKIVGVIPKQPGLRADLTVDQEYVEKRYGKNFSQFVLDLTSDLSQRGFVLTEGENGEPELWANEGRLTARTTAGLVYNLNFGEIATGDDQGATAEFEKAPEDPAFPDDNQDQKNRRYLYLTVQFDESLIPKPTEPVAPEKPADLPNETDPAKKTPPQVAYELAMVEFDAKKKTYETELDAYKNRVTAGKELVKELDERFANWYYIISAKSVEQMRASRKDLVQDKPEIPPFDPARKPLEAPLPEVETTPEPQETPQPTP